jgi:hypothetical protein
VQIAIVRPGRRARPRRPDPGASRGAARGRRIASGAQREGALTMATCSGPTLIVMSMHDLPSPTPGSGPVPPDGRRSRLEAVRARGRRLIFAQAMDALTFVAFYVVVGPSLHAERNPLILGLMALGGIQLVALVKVGLAALVARRMRLPARPSRFRLVRVAYPALSLLLVSLAVASGVVGAGFNTAALVDSLVH